ncbi:hypothetical protein AB1Y20_015572 [Prymnesium parvum]|uniref:EF-hand domain-containing protein n=1 Tax=Prymnesium parvum TaxID=97485 RepID=A0AB34JY61_PRYPA
MAWSPAPLPSSWAEARRQHGAPRHAGSPSTDKRAALFHRQADAAALLPSADEPVPPSLFPEEWHVRLPHSQRPEWLRAPAHDRFDWVADGLTSHSGYVLLFPMARPRGALDAELLEATVQQMVSSGVDERHACALAIHEVGRACGAVRCRLLGRLLERSSARWAREMDAHAAELQRRCSQAELQKQQAEREKRNLAVLLEQARREAQAHRASAGKAREAQRQAEEAYARLREVARRTPVQHDATPVADDPPRASSAHQVSAPRPSSATSTVPSRSNAAHDALPVPLVGQGSMERPPAAASSKISPNAEPHRAPAASTSRPPSASSTHRAPPPHDLVGEFLEDAPRILPEFEADTRTLATMDYLLDAGGMQVEVAQSHFQTAELAQAAAQAALSLRSANQDASKQALQMAVRATDLLKFVAELDNVQTSHGVLLDHTEKMYQALSFASHRAIAASNGKVVPVHSVGVQTEPQQKRKKGAEKLRTVVNYARAASNLAFNVQVDTESEEAEEAEAEEAEAEAEEEAKQAAAAESADLGGASTTDASLKANPKTAVGLEEHSKRTSKWEEKLNEERVKKRLPRSWRRLLCTPDEELLKVEPMPIAKAHAMIWSIYIDSMQSCAMETWSSQARRISLFTSGSSRGMVAVQEPAGSGRITPIPADGKSADASGDEPPSGLTPGNILTAGASFADYVVDWLYLHFGSRSVVALQLAALVTTAWRNLEVDTRLRMFAQFCAMHEPTMGRAEFAFFMHCLSETLRSPEGGPVNFVASSTLHPSLDHMSAVLSTVFTAECKAVDAKKLRASVRTLKRAHASIDDFLAVLLDQYSGHRFVESRAAFAQLLLRSDVNGDGEHSLDEFHALMKASGMLSAKKVLWLYRTLTDMAGCDTISAHDLALMAEADGFLPLKRGAQQTSEDGHVKWEALQTQWKSRQAILDKNVSQLGKQVAKLRESGADYHAETVTKMLSRVNKLNVSLKHAMQRQDSMSGTLMFDALEEAVSRAKAATNLERRAAIAQQRL